MTRLQVIHVASGREWRGGERQAWLLARGLASEPGVEQVIVTRRGSVLEARCRASGIAVRPTAWAIAQDPRALISVLSTLRRAAEPTSGGAAILHAHDPHALVIAGVAGGLTGTPFVASRRVDFHLRRPGFWTRAGRIIAVSEAVKRILVDDGVDPAKVVVVRSATDLDAARRTVPVDLRGRLGLPPDAPVAVTVGALVGHKDHATLIGAALVARSARPEPHWVIVGDGPLRGGLERRVSDGGLGGTVHFLGQVDDPLPIIAGADCFVASSREEGLNTSILDAHALGVPVVGTDAGGIPEALAGGAGLVVPRCDPSALAQGVLLVLGDHARAAALVAAARAGLDRWSPARMTAEVLTVYRSPDSAGAGDALHLHSELQ
jgi:glycosyltransferase involved in cell wall biosynthesis